MNKIKIISEPTLENPFIVIEKPAGLPSAPIDENDMENALCQAATYFPELNNVKGKKDIEHGLLHRLDTATEGLLLIAYTQDSYDNLNCSQQAGKFSKTYSATCSVIPENAALIGGFPSLKYDYKIEAGTKILTESCFRLYGKGRKEVRPVTENSGKYVKTKVGKIHLYQTEIKIQDVFESDGQKIAAINCTISAGFRHQVRCHLAWIGTPVYGDAIYNSSFRENAPIKMEFRATSFSFPHPLTGKIINFTLR